jgi:hypothetical protein
MIRTRTAEASVATSASVAGRRPGLVTAQPYRLTVSNRWARLGT